ncbi:hypothetical protein [Nocardia sp. XZ_19_385]|uniref:hypothetical protein n=1 Tax=Nocardia sp. XZ_19_385 TaxID=2769488 RepID=UPI00188DF3DF|nr:hypothetical protein [Nocardia sp. XZ_19_385]
MHDLTKEESARLRDHFLASRREFDPEWAGRSGRFVVPGPGVGALASDPGAAHILNGFSWAGYEQIYGLTTERQGKSKTDQAVLANLEDIAAWPWPGKTDVLLAAPDHMAAVLISTDDFILVGGDRVFVETALGMTLDEARTHFQAYARDQAPIAPHLPDLADQYR